jgi:phosphomannomutase/phosphoglucomutase
MITIDGIRVNYANGWGLVRPSNTTPCLVLRFEANDEDTLNEIQNTFREKMLAVDSSLQLPF